MKELPKEVWVLVFAKFFDIKDFARLQLVSKTFQALVLDHCWTKVKKIAILNGQEEQLELMVHTTGPEQKLLLPIDLTTLLLERFVNKLTKTTAVHVNFDWMVEQRHDLILCSFFDALTNAQVKVNELHLARLNPKFHPVTTPQALARFLTNNPQTLTVLKVECSYMQEPVPVELLQAFEACLALESVNIERSEPLVQSILHGKINLKSLELLSDAPVSTVLESGAQLRYLNCPDEIITTYIEEVDYLNEHHPLHSLEKLEIIFLTIPTLPWALFPQLEHLILTEFFMDYVPELVRTFLIGSDAGRTLVCRVEDLWNREENIRANTGDVADLATAVETACGCHSMVSQMEHGARHCVFFSKWDVHFKLLIGYM